MSTTPRILIVDDDPPIAAGLRRILTKAGYEVTAAVVSGAEAIAQANANPPDLVLMDLNLADNVDGMDIAQHIRTSLDVPVIYLTGTTVEHDLARAQQTGSYGYLLKPVREKELVIAVEMAIYKHRTDQQLQAANLRLEQEIAERTQIEEALRESERTYRELVENIHEVLYSIDADGRVTYISPAIQSVLEYSPAEIIGQGFIRFFVPEDAPRARENMMRLLTGQSSESEYRLLTKSGQLRWIRTSSHPLLKGAEVIGFQGILTDITARKQAETEARERETQFRTVISRNADAMLIIDAQNQIRFVNPAAEVLFNRQETALLGSRFGTPVSATDFAAEIEIPRQDGRIAIAEMRAVEIEWMGAPMYLASLRDISEHKEMEERLRQAREAAEAANRAKSEFLANMSHELRTPLNGVLGYAQILRRQSNLSEIMRDGLEVIQRSGDHLLILLNDILDLSKIEAGKFELTVKPFNLSSALRAIVDMTRLRAYQKGVMFHYIEPPSLPQLIYGDETRLRQVLLNLLGNAVKFTEKGRVTLEILDVRCEIVDSGTMGQATICNLKFKIIDTGIGIPAAQLERIFQPFEQVKDGRMYTEGTGLGLAISRRLVRMMGSELYVRSEIARGTAFWFELALPEVASESACDRSAGHMAFEQAGASRAIIGFNGHAGAILIADDKPDSRAVLKGLLTPRGFTVLEACNGQEAVTLAQQYAPDLILIDLFMPEMDGFEAVRQIRRAEDEQRRRADGGKQTQISNLKSQIPIIAVSASVFEQTRQESLRAGCQDFIEKPITEQRLFDVLQTHLPISWVSADTSNEITPIPLSEANAEPLPTPPSETIALLYDLAQIGDIMEILRALEKIEAHDARYASFVNRLRPLAKGMRVAELHRLLEHFHNVKNTDTAE